MFFSSDCVLGAQWRLSREDDTYGKMTSFRGATAKLGACVDNELGGLAPHQCR